MIRLTKTWQEQKLKMTVKQIQWIEHTTLEDLCEIMKYSKVLPFSRMLFFNFVGVVVPEGGVRNRRGTFLC